MFQYLCWESHLPVHFEVTQFTVLSNYVCAGYNINNYTYSVGWLIQGSIPTEKGSMNM